MSPRPDGAGKNLEYLDALRGIAVLAVLLVHVSMLNQQLGTAGILAFTGQRGVQLFYVVSAFTLSLSLDSERRESYPLSNYFLRRFFRIAPLYYLAILANLAFNVLAPYLSPQGGLHRSDVVLGFLFLNGLRPRAINNVIDGGWSIAVETSFYLVLPLLHPYLRSVRRCLLMLALSAPLLWGLSRALASRSSDVTDIGYFLFLWFPVEFPVFVMGLLAYRVWREYVQQSSWSDARRKDLSMLLLATSVLIYLGCLPFGYSQLYCSSFLFVPLTLAVAIHPSRWLINGVTRFLGKVSYSVYIVHVFVIGVVEHWLRGTNSQAGAVYRQYLEHKVSGLALLYVLVLAISALVSVGTWMLIEQPGIRLGRRIIAWREGRRPENRRLISDVRDLETAKSTRDAQY